jgi:hypothetical protein
MNNNLTSYTQFGGYRATARHWGIRNRRVPDACLRTKNPTDEKASRTQNVHTMQHEPKQHVHYHDQDQGRQP